MHARPQVNEMRLGVPPGASYQLDQIDWDVETLRWLINQMLER